MKTLTLLLVAGLMTVAGCGGDDETPASSAQEGTRAAMEKKDTIDEAIKTKDTGGDAMAKKSQGTSLTVAGSEFGDMLFNAEKQAIYIFENDPKGESACYDECAEAWPPVFTVGKPVAGDGVDGDLLGTTERRDGRLQVTYDGQPLYYYAHEQPGEVRCHNVNLNGGFWWVVGPDGKRRS
jgi:predicted lipoprotein with Yx(FWY)xxD motif